MSKPNFQAVGVIETRPDHADKTIERIVVDMTFPHAGVDRPNNGGWFCEDMAIAKRLKAAIDANKAADVECIATDIHEKTYVKTNRKVYGRYMNSCLKELGF